MRTRFEEQLSELSHELILMGSLCENAIALSARALMEDNVQLAREVPALSERIEGKERTIEELCLKLLLRQQPVARDLRSISSALKMVTDMERIGHQSADIAEIVTMENISSGEDLQRIHAMASAVISMVTDSIDAFVKEDEELARSVIRCDDAVDDSFDQVKNALIRRLAASETEGSSALDLLMIAKYLERIGDHAVNIAGWVLYSITGRLESENQ
ncbi:MAG: phosphate signaling complex protein PhoU [Oscillospiraceae bacterium]|nr:phosphate signaling complex protein PhoU [Oscillospiraceae bacterium]